MADGSNMDERRRVQQLYDDLAPVYDRTVGLTERIALGQFRRLFGEALQGCVLEIAAGSGLNLPYYSATVDTVIGLDLSREMLRISDERASDHGWVSPTVSRWAATQADAEWLPFPDGAFDTVAFSLALCTVPSPERALREAIRVCRADGRIVLLEHVLSPIVLIAWALRLLAPPQRRRLGCHLTRRTIALAREMGLHIESERTRVFGIFRLVIARPPGLVAGEGDEER